MIAKDSRTLSRREFLTRAAAVAGAAALAACAPATPAPTEEAMEEEEEEPAEAPPEVEAVTLTMWKGPHKAAGDETKLCAQPTLDIFQGEHPDITVDFLEQPWGQYNEKFTAAFAAGTGPDVSYQTESFPRFVDADHIMQLDDVIAGSGFDKDFFYPRMWETCTYGGQIYALPWITGGSNLFWNKDLFEQAGLDPDTPPDTTDDFLDAAQRITALGDDIYGFAASPASWHENGQWPRRFGGRWFNEDRTECIVNSPEAMDGWRFLDDLFHKYEVAMPGAIAAEEPGVDGYFRDGFVGMITAQNVFANSIRDEVPDFRLGASRMSKGPADEPRGRACYGGVGMLAIAKDTNYPDQSWSVAQWLVSCDALKSWIGCLGFMSVSPECNFYPDDPILSIAQTTLEYTFFWPYTGWVFKFWDIESSAIESFILGLKPVDEAVEEMVVAINDTIREEGAEGT